MSRSRSIQVRPNRGTGFPVDFVWRDAANEPADLFGWQIGLMDVSPDFDGLLIVGFVDQSVGSVRVHVNWDNRLQARKVYTFRVQITHPTEKPQSTPPIEVIYQ
jgi:hypothetical protein